MPVKYYYFLYRVTTGTLKEKQIKHFFNSAKEVATHIRRLRARQTTRNRYIYRVERVHYSAVDVIRLR